MRDLFDDFMDELRKREAASRGEVPDRRNRPDPSGEDDGDGDAGRSGRWACETKTDPSAVGEDAARPRSIDDRPRTRRGPRSGGPGGPNDGGNRAVQAGRRFGLSIAIVGAFVLFLLFSVGLDLWTDALWYLSVGFDSVFFTQLTATLGLFVGAFILSAVVLLGNLWLAGRLTPPPAADGKGTLKSIMDRINDAAAVGRPAPRAQPRPIR